MSNLYIKRKSVLVAGTAILGALVAVLDWLFKVLLLKIPFPIFPRLKFDFLGIPIVLAYLLFGLLAGVTVDFVALLTISFRDPTGFSGFMKFLAEFATVLGAFIVLKLGGYMSKHESRFKIFAISSGIVSRVVVMAIANFLLLPIFTPLTPQVVILILPYICAFNAVQGVISVGGGFLVYEAVLRRLPSLKEY